jgi:hypothetical protein
MSTYEADVGSWARGKGHKFEAASDQEALRIAMEIPKWEAGEDLVEIRRDGTLIWDQYNGFLTENPE